MPDPTTASELRGLVLSAAELKAMTDWPDALVEDYLNLLDNLVLLSEKVDIEIDQKIEEIATDFADGTIPVASSGKLVSDVANLFWDLAANILRVSGIISSEGRRKKTVIVSGSPYAVNPVDEILHVDTTAGPITVNLPEGFEGEQHRITNVGLTGNSVTIVPNGTEKLNGVNASEFLRNFETLDLGYNNTTGWA